MNTSTDTEKNKGKHQEKGIALNYYNCYIVLEHNIMICLIQNRFHSLIC